MLKHRFVRVGVGERDVMEHDFSFFGRGNALVRTFFGVVFLHRRQQLVVFGNVKRLPVVPSYFVADGGELRGEHCHG